MRFPTILATACLLLASCKKEGCTDASAYNFNPDAELEDGTCQYSGCTDQLASNYDEGAEVNDGSCEYGGCMDPGALNYDETATVDDGSCDFLGCTDSEAVNYDETATIDDGSCVLLEDLQPSIDGYTYGVVQIGDQVWFSENLRTTVYRIWGAPIPTGLTDDEWLSTTEGAMAVYGEGSSYCSDYSPNIDACDEVESVEEYGRLYNWYAVDDYRGICPSGWHVPTHGEWAELKDYISSQGFDGTEGTALKSTTGWADNSDGANGNGTDDFGFSALPGGWRSVLGGFSSAGNTGLWWSSTSQGWDYAWEGKMDAGSEVALGYRIRGHGLSVRCLWDGE